MIDWKNDTAKLRDLEPWTNNPRKINDQQAERLDESFDTFGQVETIAIGPEGEVYNGHQRLKVLMQQHGGDYEVDVRVSSRPLTEEERRKLTIFLHEGATGEWDFEVLGAWNTDVEDLTDWGMPTFFLDNNQDEVVIPPSLDDLENEYGEPQDRDFWPYIRVQVSPETMEKWNYVMSAITETDDEAQKVEILLGGF